MELINCEKSVLENMYFLSGPIIAILGFFIFYQIRLARSHLKLVEQQLVESRKHLITISKREAATHAVEQISIFINKIIPLIDECDAKEEELMFEELKKEIKDFNIFKVLRDGSEYSDDFANAINIIGPLYIKIILQLESFATFFVNGIADEELACNSIGQSFYKYAERFCSREILQKDIKKPIFFPNLKELYNIWFLRLGKQKMEEIIEKDESKTRFSPKVMDFTKEMINAIPKKKIDPIGTK